MEDRRKTNPIFNDQKLKLGLFGTNCSNGLTISHVETSYEATWEHTKKIAQKADRMGFEALVPIARWRGFGGTTNFNGNCFETYTWAAGLAEATENIGIFATSHLPTVHPVMAAKMATTIDRISGGRFGINLVMGWFAPEMEMFGKQQGEHDDKYLQGQEWIDFVQSAWSEPGLFDFNGSHYTAKNVESYPKPHQAPYPALINAGNSKAGMAFSAKNVDVNFASLDTLESMTNYNQQIRGLAREEYNRNIDVMTYGLVVVRDTEKEAKAAFQNVIDKGDWDAADNVTNLMGMQSQSFQAQIEKFKERFIAGWAGYPFVGTPEQVTEQLAAVQNTGMNGIIMGMIDYNEELDYFNDNVMPLLKQAGLRH
ncbi:LLM class flavin-dependent oxidoreductase [Pseudarthrobacter sp. NPDC058329]|uniref:LLM class flavin-dependent oxidoreductase n=1 Tax=Pseudarthrobacter sp. NPDC058329 TaxID=3346448 RepID=UPI0036DF2709